MEKENINIRKKDSKLKKNIKLNGDFLIPDTKPDIINSIGINGNCIIKNEEIFDGRVRLDGYWSGNVIYLSDLGDIKSISTSLDFSDVIENENITSKDEIEYSYQILSKEVKVLNERKISLELSIEFIIKIYKQENLELLSNIDGDNIEKLEKKVIVKNFLNHNNSKASINEDVNFVENGKNIEIIKKDILVKNIEKKISYNKVLAKADANIKLLYLCDNKIKKYDFNIPVMSFIEVEGVKEEYIVDLEYNMRKFEIINNVSEKNTLNLDIDFEINCNVYDKREVKVIEDLYCLDKDVNFTKQDVNVECFSDVQNEIFEYNEKIGIDEIYEIYDYDYLLKKLEKSNGNNYEGMLELDIYYSKEENSTMIEKRVDIPFIINNISFSENFEINFLEIKSVNGEWICNFKIQCSENVKYENITILQECELVDCDKKDNYSMVIYFVKPNDTIWNIAKNFKVSMDSIINLNNISNPDKIMAGEKLYIMRG